jgi:tetratricopeptide (TPR) repeat protein
MGAAGVADTWVDASYPQGCPERFPGCLAGSLLAMEHPGTMTTSLRPTDTPTRGKRDISTALCELAQLHFQLGDWWSAHSCASEALDVARSRGCDRQAMHALARLATIEAGLGDATSCRRHAVEATKLSHELGEPPVETLAAEALGFLELGLGRPRRAVERLEAAGPIWRSSHPARALARDWPLHLADAHVRLGNRAAAERALGRLEQRATRTGSFVLAAACERSRAMLAPTDAFEARFRRALHWNSWARHPFELARTQLCFGERLRHAGRREAACRELGPARDSFEALGARPWAAAAGRELELAAA